MATKFEDHPLTDHVVSLKNGIPKVAVQLYPGMEPGRVAHRRPTWRAREGQWAIRETGCWHYLALNDGIYPRFRVWTPEEYRTAQVPA